MIPFRTSSARQDPTASFIVHLAIIANFAIPYMTAVPLIRPTSSGSSAGLTLNMPSFPTSILAKVVIFLPVLIIVYGIYLRYYRGISHIPGPFIASISNYWKIQAAWKEQMPQQNIDLHRKYGPLVRIAPDMVSVDDPTALGIIYGFKPIYRKAGG